MLFYLKQYKHMKDFDRFDVCLEVNSWMLLSGIVEAKVTDEDSEYLQVIKRHYEACTVSNKIRQVESGEKINAIS